MNTYDISMKELYSFNGLKNLINEPTCYKNSEKTTCIDLILTNLPTLSQRCAVLETGLSEFYLLRVTEWVSKNANHILLLIGTKKTMAMISFKLKFKPFVL